MVTVDLVGFSSVLDFFFAINSGLGIVINPLKIQYPSHTSQGRHSCEAKIEKKRAVAPKNFGKYTGYHGIFRKFTGETIFLFFTDALRNTETVSVKLGRACLQRRRKVCDWLLRVFPSFRLQFIPQCGNMLFMETPQTPSEKMQVYRRRLRDSGLRPVQIWVPDTRDPGFSKLVKKEIASLSNKQERDALTFIEQASDVDGWQ